MRLIFARSTGIATLLSSERAPFVDLVRLSRRSTSSVGGGFSVVIPHSRA
jgi:hypothetical protein